MEAPDQNKPYPIEAFEADLARVNVLRMRGELDAARELCRQALSRKPEHEQAYALMGDLSLEAGDLAGAAEWYEMAASHAPDSARLRQKAEVIRQRLNDQEALQTAQKLGIPTTKSRIQLFAWTLFGLVTALILVAFVLGSQLSQTRAVRAITDPLNLSAPQASSSAPDPAPVVVGFALPKADQALMDALRQIPEFKDRVQLASVDPRGPRAVVSLEAPPGEFTTEALAADARLILRFRAADSAVTLRYLRAGEPLAMAELTREAMERADREGRPLDQALSQVWPVLESPSTSPASPPPPKTETGRQEEESESTSAASEQPVAP